MLRNKCGISVGNAGEYLVAAELELRGFTVAVPMSNTPDFDLLAIDRETHRQIAIQVKTSSRPDNSWILGTKNENLKGDNLFYVLVKIDEKTLDKEFYIIPADYMADHLKIWYEEWFNTPGKNGQPHKPTTIRTYYDENGKWKDRWDLLTGDSYGI